MEVQWGLMGGDDLAFVDGVSDVGLCIGGKVDSFKGQVEGNTVPLKQETCDQKKGAYQKRNY